MPFIPDPTLSKGLIPDLTLSQPQKRFDDFSLKKTVANIPGSAARFIRDIGTTIQHPIETGKSLFTVAKGGIQKTIPGKQKEEESFNQVIDFFKQRYGGKKNILQTIESDPVGFASDVASVLSGVGLVVKGVGTLGNVQKITQAGKTIQQLGGKLEPLGVVMKGTEITTRIPRRIVGGLVAETLGITTGAGGEVIRQAIRNPGKEFTDSLRGTVSSRNIINSSREALQKIKDKRALEYQYRSENLFQKKTNIDISSIAERLEEQLQKFNVRKRIGQKLDFSRSTISDPAEAKRVQQLAATLKGWGSQPNDRTAFGIDLLKRRLDDFYSPSGQARAFVQTIKNETRNILNKEVPGYQEMTKEYAKASDLIDEIEKTLSLKRKTNPDSTIRKLASTLKENNELRQELLITLDDLTQKNITAQIAGRALSAGVPSGLIGRSVFATGLGMSGGLVLMANVNPAIFAGLALASPRVVGEFLNALGLTKKGTNKVVSVLKDKGLLKSEVRETLFQAGRIKEESKKRFRSFP